MEENLVFHFRILYTMMLHYDVLYASASCFIARSTTKR